MDDLTPPLLTAVRDLRWHLMNGRSIKESLSMYFSSHHDEFSVALYELWSLKAQGHAGAPSKLKGHRAQALWELIERASAGQPILEPLTLLESDIEAAADHDLDLHVATLPFKALVPLLLLQFPAFAMLLIGPLLRELTRHALVVAALLAAVYAAAPRAEAESLSSAALRQLTRSRSAAEVGRIHQSFERLRILRMACDLQLKERTVPAACYQALKFEQKWGLSSAARALQTRSRIDHRCREAAAQFRGLDSALNPAVSANCRTNVSRARELRDYQDQRDWRGS